MIIFTKKFAYHQYIQGEDYVLVLQMEIIELLIFGEEYQKKLIMSFQHY